MADPQRISGLADATVCSVPAEAGAAQYGPSPALAITSQAPARARRRPLGYALLVVGMSVLALVGWWRWGGPHGVHEPSARPFSPELGIRPQEPVASVASSDASQMATVAALLQAADRKPGGADARLLRVWAAMASGDADVALDGARQLVADAPNFALAQLVYADLLRMRDGSNPISGFGRGDATAAPAAQSERLAELLAEARTRVDAAAAPAKGLVPSQFVQLAGTLRHVVAVDVAKSRVYVLENTADGWVIQRDFYTSIGKFGYSKRTEGDMRTPLGLYFVTGSVPHGRLADRFGAAALTLNYPNQYDQLRGRTGNGIWLHGVPTSLFVRAPLATDGCVALENSDLLDLSRFIERQTTPILIAPHLIWVDPGDAAKAGADFARTFSNWRAAHVSGTVEAEVRFFSDDTRTPAVASAASWTDLLRADRVASAGAWAPTLDDVSMIGWTDEESLMVVTFHERAAPQSAIHLRRQYWLKQGSDWKIIYEGSLE